MLYIFDDELCICIIIALQSKIFLQMRRSLIEIILYMV